LTLERIDPSRAALLVIDMQNAFCHPEGTLGSSGVDISECRDIIPRIRALVGAADQAGIPVLWTVQEHLPVDEWRARKALKPHTSKRKRVSALAGTWDAELVGELKPLATVPSRVIRKHRFGSFYETRLDIMLRMLGRDALLVSGVTANACIETTIREAYLRDYDIVAITDSIGAIDARWKEAAAEVWSQYLAELATSEEVIEFLSASCSPRVRALAHLLLQTTDLPAAESFYIDCLGLTVRKRETLRNGRPLVVTDQGLGLTEGRPDGDGPVEHIAFEVRNLTGLMERLQAAGVTLVRGPEPSAYGMSLYVADPDGNQIELIGDH
jgi:nicotinamidase-related amidase/catechol 2,3-dioxygenase-like lactoylglutathione lyase family enzyme